MKKLKTLLRTCAITAALLCTSSIPSAAQEVLILTRDESGDITVMTVDSNEPLTQFQIGEIMFQKGDHGEVIYQDVSYAYDYFITDSNGFREEFLQRPWISRVGNWMEWAEVTEDNIDELFYSQYREITDGSDYLNQYHQFYADLINLYGSDARVYRLRFKQSMPEGEQFIRETVLQNEGILDAVAYKIDMTGYAYWDGELRLAFQEDYEGLYQENGQNLAYIPDELDAYIDEQKEVYKNWNTAYTAWLEDVDAENMTPAQLELSRKEAGIASEYEMFEYADEICQWILDNYSYIFQWARPGYAIRNKVEIISPESVWESVGDVDEDGKLTAADAALLLKWLADKGIGEESEISTKADINADYEYNATDAAILLSYLAAKGAGSEISLQDFIRNIS